MSKQFTFSRPVEYDPSLAQASSQALSHADVLKDEFGFEDSSDEEGGSGGGADGSGGSNGRGGRTAAGADLDGSFEEQNGRHGGGGGGGGGGKKGSNAAATAAATAELEAAHQEELDRLAEQLAEAQEARARAEESAQRTEERMEELSAMSKQAKNILVAKFRQQLKVLMAQVEEQKAMLAEDDETLEALRATNLALENGDKSAAAEHAAKIKEFKDSRTLTRENTTLRYKIEELTQQVRTAKEELGEAKAESEAAQAKIKAADGEDILSMKARVDKLEAERLIFREEIKKRHLERSKLVARLNRLAKEGDNPLDNLDSEVVPENSSGAKTNGTSAASSAEVAKLQARIKQLEASLAAAQKNASTSPAVAIPAPAAGASASAREAELNDVVKKLDELLKRRESEMNEVKDKAKEKLTTAAAAIKKLKEEYASLRNAYQALKTAGSASPGAKLMASNLARRKDILAGMKKAAGGWKASLNALKADMQGMNSDLPSLGPAITGAVSKFIASRVNETAHLQTALKKEMALRKQLFNQIQELKGNIRVYCRVRPMSERERADKENTQVISFPAEGELLIQNYEKKTSHPFEFEKVFDPSRTQEEVFAEVSDLVISVLDGYNVCIFAYGQTGSGKTHTMQGPPSDPGVNIRALTKLFEVAAERAPDIRYDIKVSLLEIYNEKIQDLLGEKGRVLKAVPGQYGMEVQDLTFVSVSNEKEVLATLARGSKSRSVTRTEMNDASSRSHLILSVYVMARNTLTGKDTMGKLHLIDLAGSERVLRSGVSGDALKEAQNINQSLLCLGNVISARANKQAHVPYRDSSLTYLLQDSLSANSKTLMFVQVSPVKNDSSESICSLKFAERVRQVELGKANKVAAKK